MAPQLLLFLHISSSWVKIRLPTENQLPRLPGSALKVPGWVVVDGFLVAVEVGQKVLRTFFVE